MGVRGTDKRAIGYPSVGLSAEVEAHKRLVFFVEGAGLPAGDYGDFYAKFDPDYARVHFTGPFVGAAIGF